MDGVSVTRSPDPALASVVADASLCAQVADALGIEDETAERAFLGEPVEVVLAMAEWALSRGRDDGFDPEAVLPAWARRRGRGAWREGAGREEAGRAGSASQDGDEPNGKPSKRELAVEIARYWQEYPEELVAALDRTACGFGGDGEEVG